MIDYLRKRVCRRLLFATGQEAGQAAVELLLALPVAMLILVASWQAVLAGHSWWQLSESARVAARAAYVSSRGGPVIADRARIRADADRMAARVLPPAMDGEHRTSVTRTGAVVVSARLPLVAPLAAAIGRNRAPRITARSKIGQ